MPRLYHEDRHAALAVSPCARRSSARSGRATISLRDDSLQCCDSRPDHQIALRRGLDLNWVINGRAGVLRRAARISDPDTGIAMDVSTTQPGMQIYTNNVMRTTTGKGGRLDGPLSAICIETQHYPDSPNHPEFPSTVVTPASPLHEVTVYRFSTGG